MKYLTGCVRMGLCFGLSLLAVTFFNGCALFMSSGSSSPEPATTSSSEPEPVIEGVWKQASNGNNYEISSSGETFNMSVFKIKSNGDQDYISTPLSFERGARRVVDSRHGYLYGYNKSRPGWIAYYYSISGNNMNLTSCINDNGGATWPSLDDAMNKADISRPGTVKMDVTR